MHAAAASPWTLCYVAAVTLLLLVGVTRICRRQVALRKRYSTLVLLALVWVLLSFVKLDLVERHTPILDAHTHHFEGQRIATQIRQEGIVPALRDARPGNRGFQFALGLAYRISGTPELPAVYATMGAFAFLGLLHVLEILVQAIRSEHLPIGIMCLVLLLPSALFWTTTLNKEAIMLWSVSLAMTPLGYAPAEPICRRAWLSSLFGLGVMALLRPHIAIGWFSAICLGLAWPRRWVWPLLAFPFGLLVLAFLAERWQPELAAEALESGATATLESGYEARKERGSAAITRTDSPIPVLSGLVLLLLRPFPGEVPSLPGHLSSVEISAVMGLGGWGWLRCRERRQLVRLPLLLGSLLAVLCLSLFFSYVYNLGLLTRQRVQVYPAILCWMAAPYLVRWSVPANRPGTPVATGVPR